MNQFKKENINTTEQILQIIQNIIGDGVEININSDMKNTKNWDSLNHLNLIIELENAFNISFSMEEMEEMKSVSSIITIINNK